MSDGLSVPFNDEKKNNTGDYENDFEMVIDGPIDTELDESMLDAFSFSSSEKNDNTTTYNVDNLSAPASPYEGNDGQENGSVDRHKNDGQSAPASLSVGSSDSESDDDEYSGGPQLLSEDGRPLSSYEQQRLERIRRNREYLAQLGLEDTVKKQQQSKSQQKVKRSDSKPVPTRTMISRRSKSRAIRYAEPSDSLRNIMNGDSDIMTNAAADGVAHMATDSKKENAPESAEDMLLNTTTSAEELPLTNAELEPTNELDKIVSGDSDMTLLNPESQSVPERKKRKEKPYKERMALSVYKEMLRLRTHKGQVIKDAEKLVRAATKEVRIWRNKWEKWSYQYEKQKRQRQREEKLQREAEAKRRRIEELQKRIDNEVSILGSTTSLLLREVDARMPEILSAVKMYDEAVKKADTEAEKRRKDIEDDYKIKAVDAFDTFPKTKKNAESLLNTVLLSRAPNSRPAFRRSTRLTSDETRVLKPKKRSNNQITSLSQTTSSDHADSWQGNDATLEVIGLPEINESANSSKRRMSRNVGGWITPSFSSKIDRIWLSKNDNSGLNFDPSFYVPQIGDTVLYYVAGHRRYVDTYPDFIGKTTRNKNRIPLWVRARHSKKEGETQADGSLHSSPETSWWTEEWLSGVDEGDLARYPILCRVERTHTEFPQDSSKNVPKDPSENGSRLQTQSEGPHIGTKDADFPKLRLVVTLQPLAPILPPVWKDGVIEPRNLSPPPLFSVVTFPSELDPFIIPFSWAYSVGHSLKENQMVTPKVQGSTEYRIEKFDQLEGNDDTFRLGDRMHIVSGILSRIDASPCKSIALEHELRHQRLFSEKDARAALDVLSGFVKDSNTPVCSTQHPIKESSLFDLILSTLPIWRCTTVILDSTRHNFSPWDFLPQSFQQSPWFICRQSFLIGEGLRSKVEAILDDVIKEHPSSEIFFAPVTEREAPNYYCAVPSGICLSLIRQRLKSTTRTKNVIGECYYRSVDAILSDIDGLLDNCVLYNDPESEIVQFATDVVSVLHAKITRVVHDHNLEIQEARKIDLERRNLAFHQSQRKSSRSGDNAMNNESFLLSAIDNPFKDKLNRSWLEQVTQGTSLKSVDSCCEASSQFVWMPQVGDKILYSPKLHRQFVEGHYPSQEPSQWLVQLSTENRNDGVNSLDEVLWFAGDITWARDSFPKAVSKRSGDDALTFLSNSPMVSLGLKLTNAQDLIVLHWRPCALDNDPKPVNGVCPACGLSCPVSFLRLDANDDVSLSDSLVSRSASTMSDDEIQSIDRCFCVLKQRCIDGLPPGAIDFRITKGKLKAGMRFPPKKLPELPSYWYLLEETSKCMEHTETQQSNIESLVQAGFLPRWVSASGIVDEKFRFLCESLLPNTKLCLEFILIRLRNRYYRSKKALQNDIIESYLSAVFLLLAEAARRKKSPISIKRVAKLLSPRIDADTKDGDEDGNAEMRGEELEFAQTLRPIRELYAAAIAIIMNTSHASFLFGNGHIGSKNDEEVPIALRSPIPEEARRKLSILLDAVGIDPKLNRFGRGDTQCVEVKISCNGRNVTSSKESFVPVQTYATATVGQTDVKVKFLCNDEFFTRRILQRQISSVSSIASPSICQRREKVKLYGVSFYPGICEGNETLAKLIFGRTNRSNPCARCCLSGQSMLTCRVKLGHSNPDFDWFSSLGGAGGIDGLLLALRNGNAVLPPALEFVGDVTPESSASDKDAGEESVRLIHCTTGNAPSESSANIDVAQVSGNEDSVQIVLTNQEQIQSNAKLTPRCESYVLPQSNTDVNVQLPLLNETMVPSKEVMSSSNPPESVAKFDELEEDPTDDYEQAKHIFDLAEQLYEDAKRYSEAPIRFCRDFVDGFPVDDEDGHYAYCIICGLIGDLLCCDGCPNVVHQRCIELKELPDGEWFCEECVARNRRNKSKLTGDLALSSDLSELETGDLLPFGRMDFDDARTEDLFTWIDELREKRGMQQLLTSTRKNKDGDAVQNEGLSVMDNAADDSLQSHNGVSNHLRDPRQDSKLDCSSTHSGPGSPTKRKRGRPRKYSQATGPDAKRSCPDVVGLATISMCDSIEQRNDDRQYGSRQMNNAGPQISEFSREDDDVLSIESTSSAPLRGFLLRRYAHPAPIFERGEVTCSNRPGRYLAPEPRRASSKRSTGLSGKKTTRSKVSRISSVKK